MASSNFWEIVLRSDSLSRSYFSRSAIRYFRALISSCYADTVIFKAFSDSVNSAMRFLSSSICARRFAISDLEEAEVSLRFSNSSSFWISLL